MASISVDQISKSFGTIKAVQNVSFEVNPGEIFGLLGPNGSGKTTTIRMILNIYEPDSGKISILGGPMNEAKKNQIGYLPEERGLYQDIPLERCMTYLATLKGMSETQIQQELPIWLEKFDLSAYRKKKIKDLSKGMQQKAQLIAALIHNPEIIIVDEPFSALDPLNTQLVKDLFLEQRNAGKTIIMSTHQMNQVELLCDHLVLIDHGINLLQGELQEVKERFATHDVILKTRELLPEKLAGVAEIQRTNNHSYLLKPQPGITPQELLAELVRSAIPIESFEIAVPSLDEIFIQVVQEGQHDSK